MDFVLFIVLNAVLLIRPEELYPEIAGLRLYLIVIVVNLLAAFPKVAQILLPDELKRGPITVCVVGLLAAAGVSHVAHGRFEPAQEFVPEFAKLIAYYLLLVAVIDRPERFRAFLGWQVALIGVVAVIGILQYHDYIDFDAIKPIVDRRLDDESGELTEAVRMVSSGIFNDPNDLCLLLVFGSFCCLYQATLVEGMLLKVLWAAPVGLFGYALMLTQSRGGLLGLLAGAAAWLCARLGWKRTLPLVVVGAPIAILAIGGRQAQLSGDTAHERLMLWASGLAELFASPYHVLTGIGTGEYEASIGQVAHNSFVQAYVETGLLGGTLFTGAFVLAVWMLFHWRGPNVIDTPLELAAAWPYVLAMIVGYAAGIFSLSRLYSAPTYMCLGLAAAWLRLAMPEIPTQFQVSLRWAMRLALAGAAGLAFLKFFTQAAGTIGI